MRKVLPVLIITYLGEEQESEREIDYNNRESRDWLQRHIFWAATNGRSVEIGTEEVFANDEL